MERISFEKRDIYFEEYKEIPKTKRINLKEFLSRFSLKKISPEDGFIRGILVFNKITNLGVLRWRNNNEKARVWLTFMEIARLDGFVEVIWENG